MDFVEICNVYARKMTIKAAKRIFNSDKICRSYSDLNSGVTFLEHSVLHFFRSYRIRDAHDAETHFLTHYRRFQLICHQLHAVNVLLCAESVDVVTSGHGG